MGTAIKHPVPDRVKPSFVIIDIRALWRSAVSTRVPGCKNITNDSLTRSGTGCFIAVPIWHSGHQRIKNIISTCCLQNCSRFSNININCTGSGRYTAHCMTDLINEKPTLFIAFHHQALMLGLWCRQFFLQAPDHASQQPQLIGHVTVSHHLRLPPIVMELRLQRFFLFRQPLVATSR